MPTSSIQRRLAGSVGPHSGGAIDLTAHSVLVADSDVKTRYLLAFALRDAGLQTVQADTGPRALQFAEHVSAVLLDVDLPGVDGLEVCRMLRRSPRTARIPVIHMSAAAGDAHEAAAAEAGANAFLRRPVAPEALAATVIDLLSGPR